MISSPSHSVQCYFSFCFCSLLKLQQQKKTISILKYLASCCYHESFTLSHNRNIKSVLGRMSSRKKLLWLSWSWFFSTNKRTKFQIWLLFQWSITIDKHSITGSCDIYKEEHIWTQRFSKFSGFSWANLKYCISLSPAEPCGHSLRKKHFVCYEADSWMCPFLPSHFTHTEFVS